MKEKTDREQFFEKMEAHLDALGIQKPYGSVEVVQKQIEEAKLRIYLEENVLEPIKRLQTQINWTGGILGILLVAILFLLFR